MRASIASSIAFGVQPGDADGAVGFVHRADGGDAQRVFGHARAVAEAGFARVAGFCVDVVQRDHARKPSLLPAGKA